MVLAASRSLVAQPNVQISQLPTQQVRISWSQAANGFLLEVTPNIGPNAVWTTVDATPVPEGVNFTVTIPPGDNRRFYRLRQALQGLTALLDTSPEQAETGVAVTRETVVRFSGPLAANTEINNEQFFAQFGARRILSRIHLSTDRQTLTLFYLEPLPSGARARVTLKGEAVKDGANRAVDLDRDGIAGGDLLLDFDTLSLAAVSQTAVSGRVFASQLKPSADGTNTFVNVPLGGVTITVDGMEQSLRTVTDGNGNFRLEPVPAGEFFVHIDGRTVTNLVEGIRYPDMAYYPNVGKKWESVAGQNINLGEIYLPLIPADTLKPTSIDQDTTLTFNAQFVAANPQFDGVSITVPANSLFNDNGTRGGMVGIAPVPPDRLPGPLPDGLGIQDVITIQTDGASNFDVPVPACFPNLPDSRTGEKLSPGAKSALWSFNHDTGRFEVVGPMTVSADGRLVCTDSGVGILAPGWHGQRPGVDGEGGDLHEGGKNNKTRARPTGPQECAQDDCDCDGNCKTDNSVILHSGEERLERMDLYIPGRGQIHFELQRVYRSRLDYNGPLGHGWTFNYDEGLFIEPNGDVVRVNGRSRVSTWVRQPDGSFSPPVGDFRDLIQQPDGNYLLRSIDGFQRLFRQDGRLFSLQDRYGNRMLFDYDHRGNLKRVIDVYGREIEFKFASFSDGVDRLVSVKDFVGREIIYKYDANADLVEVRSAVVTGVSTGNDFPQGRTERYSYSSGFAQSELNHNLLSVTAPEEVAKKGPPTLSWTYGTDPGDAMTFDRVLTEMHGGTNASGIPAGGTMTFHCEEMNMDLPMGDPDIPRMRTTVTARNGNKTESYHNEANMDIINRQLTRGLRPDEPPYYETRSYFNTDGQLVRRIFPEGNEIRYTYNTTGPRRQRQNVIEIRQIAGSRGGGDDIVTTFTYEPFFNQVASITGPLGNAPNYIPPIGTASPARYTTRYFYDYQESNLPVALAIAYNIDLSQVARGLGDLNGDGRTDQAFGNLVRVQEPSVELRQDSKEASLIGSATQQIITETQWNDRGQQTATIDAEGNVTRMIYYRDDDPDGDGEVTFSPYVALTDQRTGYLQSMIRDAETSPRRRQSAPAPLALETRKSYDRVGNVVAVRNARGVTTELEFNQLNEVVKVTRGADISEAIRAGQLLSEDEAKRYVMRFFYDANGRRVRRETENRDSNTEGVGQFIEQSFTYDILGNLVQRTSEVAANTSYTWHFRYDPEELPILTIKPEGNRDSASYDERNLPFRVTRGLGSPQVSTMEVDYDRNGNRRRIIDAEDNTGDGQPEATTLVYDGFNRLVGRIDPLGNETRRAYDVAGRLTRLQMWGHPANNPAGPKVLHADLVFHHDELNRVFQTDSALFVAEGFAPTRPVRLEDQNNDGWVTFRTEYDALSRVTFEIDDDLQTTRALYDGAGRVIEVSDHVGNRTRTVYDRNSNPIAAIQVEVSPEGLVENETFTTTYVYDQLDRLVRATDNAGQTTRFAYDSRDNLVHRSDPQGPLTADPLRLFPGQINGPGNTVSFVHDGLDRTIREIIDLRVGGVGAGAIDSSNPDNPDGKITLISEYDGNSRLVGSIDDNGNRTRFGYDALDRKTAHIFADGKSYVYTYDKDDNIRSIVDPNGTLVTRTYDGADRISEETVARASGVLGTTRTTFGYDGVSRQVYATDDNGNSVTSQHTVEYIYNSVGHVLEERQDGKAISSQYTGDGKRVRVSYPGGRSITRTFDPVDRIKSIRDGTNALATTDWIGPGMRELRRVNGNATTLSFLNDAANHATGYDSVQRLVGLRVLGPGATPIVNRQYAYNRASHRTGEQRLDDSGLVDRYTYDSVYRIIRSEFDLDGTPGASLREIAEVNYRLDGVGNRRSVDKLFETLPRATETYAVNEVNEYTSVGGMLRFNDENGNLTDDGRRLFSYDYKDRLVAVRDKASGAPIANYEYLSGGRRVRKILFTRTPPAAIEKTMSFFWDGSQEVEEQDTASGATEATFVWSPVFVDELVQYQNSNGSFYTHQDARGNVVSITDGNGAVVERTRFTDFGEPEILSPNGQARSQSAVGNIHFFQGRRLDPETGLLYFRSRYYDPATGRFLQRDPVDDPVNSGNQYTFVGNNPVTSVDPFGLQTSPAPIQRTKAQKEKIAEQIAEDTYWSLKSSNQAAQWGRAARDAAGIVISEIFSLGYADYPRSGTEASFAAMRQACEDLHVGHFPSGSTQTSDPSFRHEVARVARGMASIAKLFGWGNCQESSAVVATELHDRGFSNVEIMRKLGEGSGADYKGGEHVFVVLDRAPGSDPADPSTWGPDAIIVDGWKGKIIDPLNNIDALPGKGTIQTGGVLPNPGDPCPPVAPASTGRNATTPKKADDGSLSMENLARAQQRAAEAARKKEEERQSGLRQREQEGARRTQQGERNRQIEDAGKARNGTLEYQRR